MKMGCFLLMHCENIQDTRNHPVVKRRVFGDTEFFPAGSANEQVFPKVLHTGIESRLNTRGNISETYAYL